MVLPISSTLLQSTEAISTSSREVPLRSRCLTITRPLSVLSSHFPKSGASISRKEHSSVEDRMHNSEELASSSTPNCSCDVKEPIVPPTDARLSEKEWIVHGRSDSPFTLTTYPENPSSASSPTSTIPTHSRSRNESELSSVRIGTFMRPERMNRRLFCSFFVYFACGWGDGVTGTMLPYFEADFHLSYMTSSLLFAASTVGFAAGTLLMERIMVLLGRFYLRPTEDKNVFGNAVGHSLSQSRFLALFLASILHASFFAIMGSKSGYASMLVGYAAAAFARAFLTATLNMYVSSTPKKALGYILGFWSIGAFCAPLVCQTIIATGVPWPNFYRGSLVISAVNISFITFAFHPTQTEFQHDRESALEIVRLNAATRFKSSVCESHTLGDEKDRTSFTPMDAPPPVKTLRKALRMPYQWAFSIFAWIYSGSETTVQGFMVTYLLVTRHANPKTVGYVTSGFWGGQALSRFIWGYYTPQMSFTQRKYTIHLCIGLSSPVRCHSSHYFNLYYLAIAIIMHIMIWFVQSNVENAFSTGILGVVYGPIFPGTLGLANDVLPADVHMVSMAIISAFASFGSALFPFITGTIANLKGAQILTYVTVAQTATLFCLWCLFPSRKPSREGNYS